MVKIFTVSKSFSGMRGGVRFINGEGETSDKTLIEWFKSKGYSIGEPAAASGDKVITKEQLADLKRDDLVELAKKYEIEQPQKTKSEEIIAEILKKLKK